MTLSAALAFVAAISCLEVSIIFAVLYLKVSRRGIDLVLSLLSLSLAWITLAELMETRDVPPALDLLYLRMQYVGAFAAVTFFLHLMRMAVNAPLPRTTLILAYVLGIALSVFACTDLFLRMPAQHTPFLAGNALGPFFPILAPALVLGAFLAWVDLIRGFRLHRETGFAPLTAHTPLIFLGGIAVIIACALIISITLVFPQLRLSINPLPVAVLVFCLFVAVGLGREVVRGEFGKATPRGAGSVS